MDVFLILTRTRILIFSDSKNTIQLYGLKECSSDRIWMNNTDWTNPGTDFIQFSYRQEDVVWETLSNIEGDSHFVNHNFNTTGTESSFIFLIFYRVFIRFS